MLTVVRKLGCNSKGTSTVVYLCMVVSVIHSPLSLSSSMLIELFFKVILWTPIDLLFKASGPLAVNMIVQGVVNYRFPSGGQLTVTTGNLICWKPTALFSRLVDLIPEVYEIRIHPLTRSKNLHFAAATTLGLRSAII